MNRKQQIQPVNDIHHILIYDRFLFLMILRPFAKEQLMMYYYLCFDE